MDSNQSRPNYTLSVVITVNVTFLNESFSSDILNVSVSAKLIQRAMRSAFSLRPWVLQETKPGGPEGRRGAKKASKKPQVLELVSTTAYSHLCVNGLYEAEHQWTPTGANDCLNSCSWDRVTAKYKIIKKTHFSLCLFRLGLPQVFQGKLGEICSLTMGSRVNKKKYCCASLQEAKGRNRRTFDTQLKKRCES